MDTSTPGYKTTEFWLSLLLILISAAFATKLIGPGTELASIASTISMTLAALGYGTLRTVHKNAVVRANGPGSDAPANDNAPAAAPSTAVVNVASIAGPIAILMFVLMSSTGCKTVEGIGGKVVGTVVDCTTSNASSLIKQFAPTVESVITHATGGDGKVDVASVEAATKSFGVDVGGCVLAHVVALALKPHPVDPNAPKSSPLEADQGSLRAAFEQLRASQLGGKTFKTTSGSL